MIYFFKAHPFVRCKVLPGFPGGSEGKRICLQCRRSGFVSWVGKIPWRREWQPAPVFLPGEFHGQRSLGCYSPWGCKELHTIDWLIHMHKVRYLTGKPWSPLMFSQSSKNQYSSKSLFYIIKKLSFIVKSTMCQTCSTSKKHVIQAITQINNNLILILLVVTNLILISSLYCALLILILQMR